MSKTKSRAPTRERSPSPERPTEAEFINELPFPQFLEALKMYRAQRKVAKKEAAAKKVTHKRCSKCFLTIRLEHFSLQEDGKYGRLAFCKLCKKSKNSEYYKKIKKV